MTIIQLIKILKTFYKNKEIDEIEITFSLGKFDINKERWSYTRTFKK